MTRLTHQTFQIVEPEDGDEWRATQAGKDLEGVGANPARAIEDYARQIAEEHYETPEVTVDAE